MGLVDCPEGLALVIAAIYLNMDRSVSALDAAYGMPGMWARAAVKTVPSEAAYLLLNFTTFEGTVYSWWPHIDANQSGRLDKDGAGHYQDAEVAVCALLDSLLCLRNKRPKQSGL